MKRKPLILLLLFLLTLFPPLTGRAEAGKGRGYSSGGSRGSSSTRSSGRGYSSGSRSGRSSPAPQVAKPPAASRPAAPSFDRSAAATQRKQESQKAFQSRSTPPRSGGISPQGRSYSAQPPTSSGRSHSLGGVFDRTAADAQRRQESKVAFTQGSKPKPTYRAAGGEARPLDPSDKRVEEIRRDTDLGRWATREERRRTVFRNPPPPPVVIYHDPYSNWFWWWLLSRDLNTRAGWAYHHQSDMDQARYHDLLAKDQKLEARIRELEAQKTPRDPTYAPPGIDPDLMYDEGFVEAAINPQPAPPPSHWLWGAVWRIALVLAAMAFLVWLVFIKRWGGD
jgi:hypothetical protein